MRTARAWRCRCGYAHLGTDRCSGCRRRGADLRGRRRGRRVVGAASIAVACMAANALLSPGHITARAALAPPAAPPPVAAPPPARPHATRTNQARPPRPTAARRSAAPAPGRPVLLGQDRCSAARQAVENAGDHLPAGFDFRCPDSEYPTRWGATSLRSEEHTFE